MLCRSEDALGTRRQRMEGDCRCLQEQGCPCCCYASSWLFFIWKGTLWMSNTSWGAGLYLRICSKAPGGNIWAGGGVSPSCPAALFSEALAGHPPR